MMGVGISTGGRWSELLSPDTTAPPVSIWSAWLLKRGRRRFSAAAPEPEPRNEFRPGLGPCGRTRTGSWLRTNWRLVGTAPQEPAVQPVPNLGACPRIRLQNP